MLLLPLLLLLMLRMLMILLPVPCGRLGLSSGCALSVPEESCFGLGYYDILCLPCSEAKRRREEGERGGEGRGVAREPTRTKGWQAAAERRRQRRFVPEEGPVGRRGFRPQNLRHRVKH